MSSGVDGKTEEVKAAVRGNMEARASRAELLSYFRQMLMIRRFEEKTAEMYKKAKIGGYCHLNLGEEASIVGALSTLDSRDYIYTNYREHGYALARGMAPGAIMAELFGKEDGCSKGRGGSMHLFDNNLHFMGGYGIVGGQLPLATGAGFALTYKGEDGVVIAQMGDGATAIGAFHESLNLAKLWNLPVIFLVINNLYGMGTPVEKSSAVPELYRRARAYDMYAERVDGNDVLAVRDAMQRAVRLAREDKEPSLIELMSFRMKGHSVVDPDRYRTNEEKRYYAEHDPIQAYEEQLIAEGILTPEMIETTEAEIEREVESAVEFAEKSAFPKPEDLFQFMYATSVPNAVLEVKTY
ncbi:MAG: pyruvate dehydrogenase (acetyl-transferring) E1 component subunit alpha [Chloroflexi bacterium]|uniref:Pyruvate dehydrogenase E1 component subunit alpha n=1 Tax=Candidatus Chlorohelix allophototropha TaxID=3003348 RepID=A0A8T7LY13_9CHLR|nr:pyruvate dehydrogenase (acetyl-transferring) E1 component subunit alpha [Chloroflexota bacterium]WJW67653.1 pyruvate dehydrogenase (acetyl-transferring) E1 component subunit alpha [Chloroflexota bacterium L227-S17]